MPLDPETRYTRTPDFESRAAGLEFPPEVWSALSVLEQPSNAREIAAALLAPLPAALLALERLLEAGLVQAKAIGWREFAQRPKNPVPAATRALGDAIVSIRLSPATKLQPALVNLRLGSAPAPAAGGASASAATAAGWKLRPALDAIAESAGGGVPGQLLVYKVFLQLPPELLKKNGIESVSTIPPDYVLQDPALRDALIAAAQSHASIDLSGHFAA
jgi:hypothetical protein